MKIDVQDDADFLFQRERAGKDGSGKTFQQHTGVEPDAGALGVEVAKVSVSALERAPAFLRPLARIANFNDGN